MLVDARGMECPKPVILTKKALESMNEGTVETVVDNEVAKNNLNKLAGSMGYEFKFDKVSDTEFHTFITIAKGKKVAEKEEPFVVMIGQNKMGEEEELGKILIKSFIYTVRETEPYPKAMLFYNSGVKLTCEGSEVLEDLKYMEEKGVQIISCGSCLDFLHLKENLRVGEIGNMYLIYETAKSGRTVSIG